MPGLSVIIPARNAERFLGDALDSVFAQGLDAPEVVVIDDDSSDRTADVARRYGHGVRVLSIARAGSGKARNAGLAATTGELVAFLDADDIWVREKSALQIPLLERDPGLGLVFSDMRSFDESGPSPRTYFEECGFDGRCAPSSIFLHDMISTPTVVMRRSCLAEVGVFDESLPIGQDSDLWFRVALRFPFAAVAQALVMRRFHPGNTTRDGRLLARCAVKIWERYAEACIEREPALRQILRRDLARKRWHHHLLEGCALIKEGRPREARRFLRDAIRDEPLRLRPYAFYLASLLGGRSG